MHVALKHVVGGALLAFGFAATVAAQQVFPLAVEGSDGATLEAVNESTDVWFVELASAPAADGTDKQTLKNEKASFRALAAQARLAYSERFAFDTLFNGLSVRVSPSQLSTLRDIPGVKAIYPVVAIQKHEALPGDGADMGTALDMTGADFAQSELGLDGTGVRVAVMDTGIDYHHPDLGGCFGPGCRVAVGWDFVGDAYNNDSSMETYNPIPTPDAYPDDCGGHGSHVAGIVGASGNPTSGGVRGVAPGVTFGAYRVFGCEGSTSADIMIAAMERALADGMQVLNMSIGSSFQWPQYPTAVAADRLVKKGVVVVASIGNSGANGLFSAGAPGVGEKVIGVASFENTHLRLRTFAVTPDGASFGYNQATAAPTAPLAGTYELVRTGTSASAADACAPLAAGSLAGKVALIRRGTCSFNQKSFNAQSAGAAAVIIYNNVPGIQLITVAGPPAIGIPVVSIDASAGVQLNSRLADIPIALAWTDQFGTFPNVTGNQISSFSSYGHAPDLSLKPDIGAPGGLIRSTYPLEAGGYATISGTSMASPHTAGAVALFLQARPGMRTEDVRTVLQNNATPRAWWGNPGLGFLDNVHRQGAGMLQIDDAILSTVMVSPGKLALGESEAGPSARTLTVQNFGLSAVTLNLSHSPALATGPNTFAPAFFTSGATVAFNASSITVPAGGSATVAMTVTAPPLVADNSQFGGYIVLSEAAPGTAVLRVPYSGFKGDYQSIKVLTPTANGFPWLASQVGASFVNKPSGAAYSLVGNDVPYFIVHFDHQSQRVDLEIQDAATGKPVHPVFHNALELEHFGRNSTATSFFSLAWDGTRLHSHGVKDLTKVVPDGKYQVVIKVLKALGDPSNLAHTETWTSPVITIDRP